jgi:hypothetical protein
MSSTALDGLCGALRIPELTTSLSASMATRAQAHRGHGYVFFGDFGLKTTLMPDTG